VLCQPYLVAVGFLSLCHSPHLTSLLFSVCLAAPSPSVTTWPHQHHHYCNPHPMTTPTANPPTPTPDRIATRAASRVMRAAPSVCRDS